MRKVLTSIALLLLLAGCTAQTTSLEYYKWIPVSQSDSSLKTNQKEVRVPENQK